MNTLTWQQQLADVYKNTDALLSALELQAEDSPHVDCSRLQNFPLRVPKAFVQRMQKGDWYDPLLLQVLPLKQELAVVPGYRHDPLLECDANPVPGLLHKYRGRVLLTVTGACAIHCRYCFRRHFPYEDNNPNTQGGERALDYIRQHDDIREVILSGGDPLSANDKVLTKLIANLEAISHVKYLRIHTRLPVVIPSRVTKVLLNILQHSRLKVTVVLHCNHENEIDDEVSAALLKLKLAGIVLLNQSVLLKGVNNHAEVLQKLSYKLFDNSVLPYYLHLLDKVSGAAHFYVEKEEAIELVKTLIESVPGYLVPRLVVEEPKRKSKIPIDLQLEKEVRYAGE